VFEKAHSEVSAASIHSKQTTFTTAVRESDSSEAPAGFIRDEKAASIADRKMAASSK